MADISHFEPQSDIAPLIAEQPRFVA
jgi:hypothetical protein